MIPRILHETWKSADMPALAEFALRRMPAQIVIAGVRRAARH